MPVSPDKQRLYPGGSLRSLEWQEIRHRILKRADHRSEKPNCRAINYLHHAITGSRVILTIAHLDQDPTNNDTENLVAPCQYCHNRLDAPVTAEACPGDTRARGAGWETCTCSKTGRERQRDDRVRRYRKEGLYPELL